MYQDIKLDINQLTKGRLANGRLAKGRLTNGRLTNGRLTNGRLERHSKDTLILVFCIAQNVSDVQSIVSNFGIYVTEVTC